MAVKKPISFEVETGATQNPPFVLVIQSVCTDAGGLFGTQRAPLIAQGLGASCQVTTGNDAGVCVRKRFCVDVHIAMTVAGMVGIDPGLDNAAIGQLRAAGELDAVTCDKVFTAAQVALSLHIQCAASIDRLLGIETSSLACDRTAGRDLSHTQMPIGIELYIPATGRQRAIQLDPDTGLGTHQPDGARIHSAQGAGVNCQLRLGAAVIRARSGVQGPGIDVVATGNHRQVTRIDLGVDLRRAGDDVEAIDITGVQTLTVNGHRTAINLITIQTTIIKQGFARAKRDTGSIDKTAAITGNTVGVGHDHLGRLPRHFGITAQLAGTAAVDFVEDDMGGVALQVRVA